VGSARDASDNIAVHCCPSECPLVTAIYRQTTLRCQYECLNGAKSVASASPLRRRAQSASSVFRILPIESPPSMDSQFPLLRPLHRPLAWLFLRLPQAAPIEGVPSPLLLSARLATSKLERRYGGLWLLSRPQQTTLPMAPA